MNASTPFASASTLFETYSSSSLQLKFNGFIRAGCLISATKTNELKPLAEEEPNVHSEIFSNRSNMDLKMGRRFMLTLEESFFFFRFYFIYYRN